jgi:O-antigen/teichoic acid export membrane protein
MGDPNQTSSRGRKIGRRASYREGAAFGVLTFGSVAMLALIGSVLNSRIYGVNVIGEYALAMATVAAVRLLSTTKERPALVRELSLLDARQPRVTALFYATLTFSTVLTCVVGAIAVAVTELLLTGPISQPELLAPIAVNVAGYALIGNVGENFDVVFNSFRAGRQSFWVRVEMAMVFIAITVPFGLRYGTVWWLIAGTVGSQATGLLHRLVLVRRFMRFTAPWGTIREGFATLPGLIRFGLKITPGALADGVSNESGTWIVASFGSLADVGAYGRAYMLVKQMLILNVRTNEMLFPTLLERRAKGDATGYARALIDSLRYTTILLLLGAAAGGGLASEVMRVFGPGFERGATPLAVLLLVPPLFSLSQIQRVALYSLDRPWLGSICGLLRLVATLALGIVLTSQMGATGAALALVLGFLVDIGLATSVVIRHLEMPVRSLWPAHHWLALVLAYCAAFAAAHFVAAVIAFPFNLLIGGVVAAVVFVAVMVVCRAFNERDLERLRDVRQNLAKRRHRAPAAIAT